MTSLFPPVSRRRLAAETHLVSLAANVAGPITSASDRRARVEVYCTGGTSAFLALQKAAFAGIGVAITPQPIPFALDADINGQVVNFPMWGFSTTGATLYVIETMFDDP